MKTKTRISKTTTIARDLSSARVTKALANPATAPALWKLLGESPLLQNLRRDPKLGRAASDVVYVAKDRSHCLLIDCQIRDSGLSDSQSFLHLAQLAHYLKDMQFPLKSVSLIFLLPPGSPQLPKLLATFTEGYKLPTASTRKSNLSSVAIQGRGSRLSRNAYKYTIALTYKEEKFEIPVSVKVIEVDLGPLPSPEEAGIPVAKADVPAPAKTMPPLPSVKPAEAAPAPAPENPVVRRLKTLLDEAVSARSAEAWKLLGENPSMQRARGAPGDGGPELVYLARDRISCLLVDLHLSDKGLDEAQSCLHLPTLLHLVGTRGYAIRTAALVFLLPPGARALKEAPLAHTYVPPPALADRLESLGAGIKSPALRVGKNALRFSVTLQAEQGEVKIPLTVKWVEGPSGLYKLAP